MRGVVSGVEADEVLEGRREIEGGGGGGGGNEVVVTSVSVCRKERQEEKLKVVMSTNDRNKH